MLSWRIKSRAGDGRITRRWSRRFREEKRSGGRRWMRGKRRRRNISNCSICHETNVNLMERGMSERDSTTAKLSS